MTSSGKHMGFSMRRAAPRQRDPLAHTLLLLTGAFRGCLELADAMRVRSMQGREPSGKEARQCVPLLTWCSASCTLKAFRAFDIQERQVAVADNAKDFHSNLE